MSRVTAKLLFFVIAVLISGKSIFAYDPYATGSAAVSATVVGTTMYSATLIAPADNSTTRNSRESLIWRRPSPLPTATSLHHYDVYLDSTLFAASVSDSVTTQSYYFYHITRGDNYFHLDFNYSLSEGYHTWSVNTYDDAGNSANTGTWTYYIDTTTPFITLQKVDRQTLNWSTANPSTIPDVNHRDLTVTTADPLLTGSVERYANMQIILICPQNIPICHNQTYQGNYPSGNWQHRFRGLIKGLVYTVYISATDAGGNSVIFPQFYLAYGVVTPVPAPTTPLPPTKPTGEVGITPTPEIEIVPTPFVPIPPAVPTPPIFLTASPVTPTDSFPIFFALLVFGLPSHLVMTGYGTQTRLSNLARFLYTLFFPFFGKKTLQTLPFCTLEIFHPDQIDSTHQTAISDINGKFSLKEPLPESLFVKIICTGRTWKNTIISKSQFLKTCLFPKLESPQTPPNRLRRFFMTYRSIPLGLACITSGVALVIFPSFYFLIYLYLSFQLVFSEYLYPKLQK